MDAVTYIFSGLRNRAELTSIRMQLAAGIRLDPDKLSLNALPAVILLAYAARREKADIVEDYDRLFQRIREEFFNNAEGQNNWPWCPLMHLASAVEQQAVHGRDRNCNLLNGALETRFIWDALRALITAEPDELLTFQEKENEE